jgi:beta-barrel assembly-enhancing protease
MKRSILRSLMLTLAAVAAALIFATHNATPTRASFATPVPIRSAQYDDPYSDYRDAHYSNAGLLSEADEIKLGLQLHREVTKKVRLTDIGLDRVERLGQRCAKASLRPGLPYRFHVVQSSEINGFSLPGGHVYITTALLRLANDNELASVLAHEIGHIVARHSLKTLKKSKEYDDLAKSIGDVTGVVGDFGRDLGVALGQMLGGVGLTAHSRDEEREADFLGVRGMTRAGFDPHGMITIFQKLQRIEAQDSSLLGTLFSDHPDVDERIDSTRYEINRMQRR